MTRMERVFQSERLQSFPRYFLSKQPPIRAICVIRGSNFGVRVCAGEAGCHAGASPAGRIRLFTTESCVREEAARPNPKARRRLNCPVAIPPCGMNLIQ